MESASLRGWSVGAQNHALVELGTPTANLRRGTAFRADVFKAYLAECCVCGFLVDGLIGPDAAHIQWHSHGGPDEVPNGLALCALHHRLLDHGAITVGEDLRVRVARSLAGTSARGLFGETDGRVIRLPVDPQLYPNPEHLRWHHTFQGAAVTAVGLEGGRSAAQRTPPGGL